MGERGKAYKFILVILAIVFLFGVSFSQRSMNEFREDKKLTHTELDETLPPSLAVTTVVLGGFRGLIANILWVRAMEMQDDGKFFEMAQLAEFVSELPFGAFTRIGEDGMRLSGGQRQRLA